jgi:hypothetical protein
VYTGPLRTNTTVEVSYLNTSSPFIVQGGADMNSLQSAINAAFVGALVSPAASKSMPQDAYGNLKVPFLENVAAKSDPDAEGWHPIQDANVEYSSMVGLPTKGIGNGGLMFIRLESSYMFPVCVLSLESLGSKSSTEPSPAAVAWYTFKEENCNNGPLQGMVLQLKNVSDLNSMTAPGPRRVVFSSLGDTDDGETVATIATCNLTTTYVETNLVLRLAFENPGLYRTTWQLRSN